ncbi:D-hexose-6-phosphate mutarotase [Schaalia sp. 19OD2882]|uniref:D-hexose-6-phosphate mutarotase n=1 Tax=Schaalia sp. 19OD2882 TaxID=2794089 RepID=UPI001C1F135B|nr:D-hexose-6-phosphate mutarotase [Schaalia sp. 19OD2882]QWW20240.1 D-hexose-6-phosphate mutarotase [Schaalia sp. 19OD2882]
MGTPDRISLDNGASAATLTTLGAQLLSWAPTDDKPVLWMSSKAVTDGSRPIRGGVPVCLPWFGPASLSAAPVEPTARAHGFARMSTWSVVSQDEGAVEFELTHGREDHGGTFPHAFTATMSVRLDDADLLVELTMRNDDDHDYLVEAALHAYVAVGDLKDVTIGGLEDAQYRDLLDGQVHTQRGEVALVDSTDRIYRSCAPLVIEDPRWLRRICLEKDRSASTIVWTPWICGAREIADMDDHEWISFVCVEAGNVREDAMELPVGASRTMAISLHVDPLD